MFKKANEEFIDLTKFSVVDLFHSLNEPFVSAITGQAVSPARASILVCQSRTSLLEIFIGLFFPQSGERVLYSAFPFPPEQMNDRTSEAEAFVSQMGFMMEDL